ncbi:pentatricopeptide repeat-containing protein At3g06430, chloroplastic [Camellia sinensis]|uniref:pentatricopeptide repeat-containing protein At3g06430, chloroplastic n=1 Tax=Camellia sinensis TaxID=4442 RepID=UPI001035C15B|nr:pentatricopeptide repeat-containing protein At3g06430, chloroplastic [Camellia sinensis]
MSSSWFFISFSSSLLPSPINHHQDHHLHLHLKSKKHVGDHHLPTTNSRVLFLCAASLASTSTSSSSSSSSRNSVEKKRHWKEGEYPGIISEPSIPTRGTGYGYGNGNGRSTKRNHHPIKNLKKKMDRKNNAKAWANTVTEALSDFILRKQWLQALEVFEMLKEQPFYQPKEGTYMKLLVLLGKSGQPKHAHQLFDTMLEEGLEPTSELYTALLAAYCRSNLINKAFSILDQMKTLPLCQPDVYTYSILLKACVDASRFELVESLYEQMAERLITPNTVTQNIVLSGYGKAGKFDQMEKVLSGMLESTTSKPDVWTMNTILSLFGNKGQIEMMERWYEKFRNFGIEPETRTFNILIGAYGKKRMYDKMSSVMEYMRKLSFPWTTSTYNNVIEAFSEAGDVKHMEYTFDQMRAEGMKADTKTFCCLIKGYANGGIFHKVISTVQLAGKLEIPENTSFYNAVIFACARAEDLMEMERVFKRMKDKQCQVDSTTYSIMVDAYRKEGMNDKVYDLEQEKEMMVVIAPKDDENIEVETSVNV